MRYLTAERFDTAPFFTVWESTDPFNPPKEIPYEPEVAGPIKSLRFGSVNYMATVSDYRRSEVPGIGNPTTPDPGGIVAFSPDDNFVFVGGRAGTSPTLYRRMGPYYQPIPVDKFPVLPDGAYALQAVITLNAQLIALAPSDNPSFIYFYERQGLNQEWVLKRQALDLTHNLAAFGDDNLGGTVTNVLAITPDGKHMWQNNNPLYANAYTGKFFKYDTVSKTFAVLATPNNWTPTDFVVRPDGTYWFVFHNGSVWSLVGDTWTAITPAITSTNLSAQGWKFAKGGDLLMRGVVTTTNNTGRCFFVYQFTGSAYTLIGTAADAAVPASATNSSAMTFYASRDGKKIACGVQFAGTTPSRPLWVYEVTGTSGNYALARTNAYARTTYVPLKGFSPDGTRINSTGAFYTAQAPFQQLTSIPEAPGVTGSALATVQMVWYGQQGQASMVKPSTSGALLPVIRDGAGAYLDVRTLEGTFVSIWDRTEQGLSFKERQFVQHILGTEVSDLQFSDNGKLFSYHTERPNNADQSGLGRFIYDISQKPFMSFRGALRAAGDVASRIAYKSDSTYAVITFDSTTDNIKLLRFTTGYQFTVVDTKDVPFGIPAYSKCETVVVAHGGNPPYTLYNHIHDETQDRLQPVPLPLLDWSTDSKIFLATFMPDCSKLVIVTGEDIKLIDAETGELEEEEELEEELDDEDEVVEEEDPDEDPDKPDKPITIIVNPDGDDDGDGSSAGPGAGPGYETDGKTVNNISYVPFAAINITYRTWP